MLVKRYFPHPEFYGEVLVELLNGMVTDVYTDQDGSLFTETNNDKLIDYLSTQKTKEKLIIIEFELFTLKSICIKDTTRIHEWLLISPFRRANAVDNDIQIIYEYISHAKSMYSDVFLFSKNSNDIGLLGFMIIDEVAIINCDIYNHSELTTFEIGQLLERLISYLKERFEIAKVSMRVFEYDAFMLNVINDSIFKQSIKTRISIPTLSGSVFQYEYEITL